MEEAVDPHLLYKFQERVCDLQFKSRLVPGLWRVDTHEIHRNGFSSTRAQAAIMCKSNRDAVREGQTNAVRGRHVRHWIS